jgi:transcriptional regulator with XRE-family HTH domain
MLAKLSQEAFAERLGVTRGAVGNWELDKGIKRENLSLIVRTFLVDMNWLSEGIGRAPEKLGVPRLRLASFDDSVVDQEQPFEAEGPGNIPPFEPEAPDNSDPDAPPKIPANGIVELDARPGMGGGGQIAHVYYREGDQIETRDAIKVYPWIFPPWFLARLNARPGDLLVAEAAGDSMRPTIEPGTPLIIDTRHRIPSPDGIYAIRDRWGQVQVKRLETAKAAGDLTVKIISDNGGHVEIVRSEDEISIVGKVLGGIHIF